MTPEEARRGFGLALLKAKPECCDVCRALVSLRDYLADQMLQADAASASTLEVDGEPREPAVAPAH